MADGDTKGAAAGIAALAICEAFLLSLIDLKIMSAKQVRDVVDDAAMVHRDAVVVTQNPDLRREVGAHFKQVKASLQAAERT